MKPYSHRLTTDLMREYSIIKLLYSWVYWKLEKYS